MTEVNLCLVKSQTTFPYLSSIFYVVDGKGMKPKKFTVRFLGSVEVNYHKGNDVITNAINKVSSKCNTWILAIQLSTVNCQL